MVITYLEKIYTELLEEKIQLGYQQNDLTIKMKEHLKLIERLKKEDDINYDVLSPRNQNVKLKKHISQLENEYHDIIDLFNESKQRLFQIDSEIDELNSVMKIAKQQIATSKKIAESGLKENEVFKLKLLEAQESERQRIARELHDSPVQVLISLMHRTEFCTQLIDLEPARCKLELSSMSKNLKNTIEEIRQMIYDLHPIPIADVSFNVIVERYLLKIIQKENLKTEFSVEGEPYHIKSVIATTLYRVIHEACINTIKHAHASNISVKLCYEEERFRIIISDNGIGFSPYDEVGKIKDDNSGFGLSAMMERVYLLSGKIKIDSEIGKGTSIIIEVPNKKS